MRILVLLCDVLRVVVWVWWCIPCVHKKNFFGDSMCEVLGVVLVEGTWEVLVLVKFWVRTWEVLVLVKFLVRVGVVKLVEGTWVRSS